MMRNIVNRNHAKVFVGLSGGVDSSVAALILKERGYDVTGVYVKCFNVDGCAVQDAQDARLVAEKLGIPFYVLDLEEAYKEHVVDYLVRAYAAGITPNPDVMCNREIKFGLFLKKARALGADFVATGHYVRLRRDRSGACSLREARDKHKDQSYFLWTLTQEELAHTLFPVGKLTKPQVRKIAAAAGLPTARKKDSQGICFLGKVKIKDFLKGYLPVKPGPVVTPAGAVIGTHDGAHFYTVGQRHGLNVSTGKRMFIAGKNLATNTLVAVPAGDDSLYGTEMQLTDASFVTRRPSLLSGSFRRRLKLGLRAKRGVQTPRTQVGARRRSARTTGAQESNDGRSVKVKARIRYQQPLEKAVLYGENGTYRLVFDKPQQFVTPGQSAVCYRRNGFGGREMLCGGVIA